ncbi:MAG: transposase [bacterium]|nr:transposase [bacterium]
MNPYHNPPHLYLDQSLYFVSARTFEAQLYLKDGTRKQLFVKKLNDLLQEYQYKLYAWVVLDNHYHLIFETNQGAKLPKFMQALHGGTSRALNLMDGIEGRKVWFNYWDRCLRDDVDFNTHCDYIHYNPVKHGFAEHPEDYPFSSYKDFLKRKYYEIGWGYAEQRILKN